jgi:hypothetical protein
MKPFSDMNFHPIQEELVNILIKKTQNNNPLFFRVVVAYYLTSVASMMRTDIDTLDRGLIPVNLYAIALSPSGSAKGFSTNIIEEHVINKFKEVFITDTFPAIAEQSIDKLAIKRANSVVPYEEQLEKLQKEFDSAGPLVYTFDSGTSPAVKQMRHKLLMAGIGSINLAIDEIGSNLVSNVEVLNTFLELYDIGKVKQKLIKNTADNKRTVEIDGRTPTNMLLFGTPSKLLNGSATEAEFYSMLETGYARRCLFGYTKHITKLTELTPEQVFDMLTDTTSDATLIKISNRLANLADPINFSTKIKFSKDNTLKLIEYKILCEKRAEEFKDFEEIQKAEMNHRYYKVLKLSGAYAFVDGAYEIEEKHLEAAIKLVEESGDSFNQILTRPRIHVRVAQYLADIKTEVTQVDLMEDLPFYRGSAAQRKDIMTQAIAWGYKNNIIIKTSYADSIEFFKGESLENTNLSSMICSYGTDITTGFEAARPAWDELHKLVTASGYHYTAHHFMEGYRSSDKLIPGFNMVILDVDNGISMSTAQMLLKDYTALFATTKRHTKTNNRFRILLPISHTVKLNSHNYPKFMQNVFDWLPFDVDTQTKDCSRKWEAFNGEYVYQEGELLDAMLFIPETKKQEEQQKKIIDLGGLNNLERWFLTNTDMGNRSNTLIKYAYVLVDSGYSIEAIRNSIFAFNGKLKMPLTDEELNNTILVSVIKAVTKRDINE